MGNNIQKEILNAYIAQGISGKEYTLKDMWHDAATGSFSGAFSIFTGGLGGAMARSVALKTGSQVCQTVFVVFYGNLMYHIFVVYSVH